MERHYEILVMHKSRWPEFVRWCGYLPRATRVVATPVLLEVEIDPHLGLQMRTLRKQRRALQKDVARQMHINTAKLRAFERDELLPRVDELMRFCEALQPSGEESVALRNVYKASQEQVIDARLRAYSRN